MSWFRSLLFWKIVSIYVVLSALALGGLLLTLTQTLEENTRKFLESDARNLLLQVGRTYRFHTDLETNNTALRALRRSGNQLLILCDAEGEIIGTSESDTRDIAEFIQPSFRLSLIREARERGPIVYWQSVSAHVLRGATQLDSSPKDNPRFILLSENLAERFESASEGKWFAVEAAVVAWMCGTACLAFVATTVVTPIRMLIRVMKTREDSADRNELLAGLSERSDEFGDAARSLVEIDAERRRYVHNLEQQERGLRSTATQLSAILQAMADGVIAVDQDERILFANTVACKMVEVEPQAMEHRPVFEVIRNAHLQEAVQEALRKQEEISVEFRMARNDIYVSLVVSPVRVGGAVLVLHDTTEIRKLEAMRRDFVSGVSHELKTPLTVIQACTDTLLEGAIEDESAARNFLKQIEEQSERLLQLILGMLQLARVESGQQVFTEEPVDLREIAEHTCRGFAPLAETRSISLLVEGEEELYVLGDYQALRTVASSLVDNSIKYTPDGGEVRVELGALVDAMVMRVIDNGIGIPERDQERVFERFFRVDRDRNRECGGTGLGLAIVKHLCQAMNAEISLESAAGQGCTIEVRFPL